MNRRYAHGLTALMWAAGYDASAGVEDVDATIKTLIEHGAALDLKDDRGKTAADIAVRARSRAGGEAAGAIARPRPSPTGGGLGVRVCAESALAPLRFSLIRRAQPDAAPLERPALQSPAR